MPEAPSRVWLRQAWSDWEASKTLLNESDGSTFCQAIGKHQQSVEKAVKAVLAALRDRGILRTPTPRGHGVEEEMKHIASAVNHMPKSKRTLELIYHVQYLLMGKNVREINELCRLAPAWPPPGSLFPKNTEYPFETSANIWVAPTDKLVFGEVEIKKFKHLAKIVVEQAGKIVSAAERQIA